MEKNITIEDRINLKKLMENNTDYEDNTQQIRTVKHSEKIRDDVRKINYIKSHYSELKETNKEQYNELFKIECVFLYNNYTDIFNRLIKDEIDLTIMTQLLTVLKMIEEEQIDQEEGSIMVGKILKNLYIDSAIKRSENIDKEHESNGDANTTEPTKEAINISWKEFKLLQKDKPFPIAGSISKPNNKYKKKHKKS